MESIREVVDTVEVMKMTHADDGEFEFEFESRGNLTELIAKVENELKLNDILVEGYKVELEPPASMIQYDVDINAIRGSVIIRYPKFYMHALMDILQDISMRLELKSTLRQVEGIIVRR